jgi:hypothetical protein
MLSRIAGCPTDGQVVQCLLTSYPAEIAAGITFLTAFLLIFLIYGARRSREAPPLE